LALLPFYQDSSIESSPTFFGLLFGQILEIRLFDRFVFRKDIYHLSEGFQSAPPFERNFSISIFQYGPHISEKKPVGHFGKQHGRPGRSGAMGHTDTFDTITVDNIQGFIELFFTRKTQMGSADNGIDSVPVHLLKGVLDYIDHACMGAAQNDDQTFV
jgi:hypothetical protein